MSVLRNPRHEKFALMVAGGVPYARAYRHVYNKTRNADVLGPKLAKHVAVVGRVDEIRNMIDSNALNATLLTLVEKRSFLAMVVRTAIGTLDGSSPLVQSFEREVRGEGSESERTILKVKMPDKLRAIELDAKLAGEMNEANCDPNASESKPIIIALPAAIAQPRKLRPPAAEE